MTSTAALSNWDDDPPILELELDPTPEAPSLARAAIVGFCQDCAVSSSALATVMLLVSEIVTNAVIHPDVKSPAPVRMRASVTPEIIRVEIKDQGSGFTPQPRDPARSQGGYGLYLLDKEAMRWGVREHEGNTVWFEVSSGAAREKPPRQAQQTERSPQPAACAGPPPPTARASSATARPTTMTAALAAADYNAPPPRRLRPTRGAQHERRASAVHTRRVVASV
jgi:anti-sigma regulatory factor (Ser/Thr protein kinase)